jgi:choline dehydrogenase-like flavoprotein
MHPASRGTTHIISSDALAKPAIDPRYMSAPADVELLAAAVRFIARLSKAGPMGPRVLGETLGAQSTNSDVKEYVKNKVCLMHMIPWTLLTHASLSLCTTQLGHARCCRAKMGVSLTHSSKYTGPRTCGLWMQALSRFI